MKYYTEQAYFDSQSTVKLKENEFGCGFCWDQRKNKEKELFFLDNANNMRICTYCPSCGRKYGGENGSLE